MMRVVRFYGMWDEIKEAVVNEKEYQMLLDDDCIIEVLVEWGKA